MPFKRKRATKKTKTKTVSRVKKSKLSIDDQLKETFQKYSEEGFIEGDNLLSFIEALSIEPDDLVLLVLMEQMECEDGVEIKWIEFERGMKKLHCTTVADIKNRLDGLRSTLALPDVFENIYKYAFKLNLQDNKKILDKDTAVALWELLLVGKFDLLEQWVEFVETRADVKFISKDVFFQLNSFRKQFNTKQDLLAWQDDGAWPCVVDDFVEHVTAAKK
jgi:DCN1-like protein 1/2